MKRGLYYVRIAFFILYLVAMFLLIDNVYKLDIYNAIFLFASLIYILIIIVTILSKKIIFKDNISLNILNIGLYMYIVIIYRIVSENNFLDIMNNLNYFHNNYLIISILYTGIITYIFVLNKEDKTN